MSYLIDTLKEKIGSAEEENEEIEGFKDLNYVIGNSSAMDVGEVPTPLDERIGYASQIGGQVMELQISNPATFSIEREQMISTIQQLGIQVTLHSDMNAGYATSYKSSREGYGFDDIEKYFTQYIQELASFKREVEARGEGDQPLFKIGRINPHISTSPLPPLEERMETDVGQGPFGFVINDYDESSRKRRNHRGQNIYKNTEFLKNLYYTLFLEVSNYPFQQYQTFATYSNKFDKKWNDAKHKAADKIFFKEAETLEDKLGAVLTARGRDQGIGTSWREVLIKRDSKEIFPRYRIDVEKDEEGEVEYDGVTKEEQLNLEEVLESIGRAKRLRMLDDTLFDLRRIEYENMLVIKSRNIEDFKEEAIEDIKNKEDIEEIRDKIEKEIKGALDELWEGEDDNGDKYMAQDSKWQGLQEHLEIQQIRLLEFAYDVGKNMDEGIQKMAADLFSGARKELFDVKREDIENPEQLHEDMVERLIQSQQFQREMWKESRIFYNIIPAWMASADEHVKDEEGNVVHEGWDAPKFIWETLVERWDDKEGVNINLQQPKNGVEGGDKFFDLLEKNKEFQMDVAAASAACYVWSHFTQTKNQFQIDRKQDRHSNVLVEEEKRYWTWIDWMNKYGIGVNLETMHGSSENPIKIWRSKHIATAAHAINMTAKRRLDKEGSLGGREDIHPELDGCPAKFTIDMEHVATFGVDPWKDMEAFIDQEAKLAGEYDVLDIPEDKPIAKILRQYHLMDPGVEGQRGTHHGAFERGNELIYRWLYGLVKEGFARNENEPATILFELAEHKGETSFMMKVTMDLIELGVSPDELDPTRVDPGSRPESEEEALIARFFGIDRSSFNKEWAKIEEHAFDPLEDLMEAEPPGQDFSSRAMLEEGETRANELDKNRYK